ncbi:PREDICTED: gustatory receptor for sugar taste 43a-like [Bactrocera latifrons]|uniref:gustatory receptor for sugar taste 43a-like n=1 Tax=Bactrocera latifrons TaxID=174628 RepID=UPI0008DDFE01|nr:PREDICTED: gustatory receptor for sugar taste 43a-like [Bactrocera latifrons]
MEINESSLSVFYLSKWLALAPISIQQNAKGVNEIKRSLIFSIYAIALGLIMVILCYEGLLFDANSKVPLRMNSSTSRVVTAMDVTVVVFSSLAGIGCGMFSVTPSRELNLRLRKFDAALHSFSNFKRDRITTRIMAIIPMAISGALIAFDIWTWVLQIEISPHMNSTANVKWYIPFYLLYFVMIGFHILFANTAIGLGRRFRRLNVMLRCQYLSESKPYSLVRTQINSIKIMPDKAMSLHESIDRLNAESLPKDGLGKTRVMLLRSLAENHESLGKCVQIFSSTFGIAVLCILVSCLLHLVATSYFLFLALLNPNVTGYAWGQVLWILLHILRLLLVVEPCHMATLESKKTIQIVCEIERKMHEPVLVEEIKKFWQQLLVIDVEFSALGLCRINRNILTALSSAIATYLVILIQFQKASG